MLFVLAAPEIGGIVVCDVSDVIAFIVILSERIVNTVFGGPGLGLKVGCALLTIIGRMVVVVNTPCEKEKIISLSEDIVIGGVLCF